MIKMFVCLFLQGLKTTSRKENRDLLFKSLFSLEQIFLFLFRHIFLHKFCPIKTILLCEKKLKKGIAQSQNTVFGYQKLVL